MTLVLILLHVYMILVLYLWGTAGKKASAVAREATQDNNIDRKGKCESCH